MLFRFGLFRAAARLNSFAAALLCRFAARPRRAVAAPPPPGRLWSLGGPRCPFSLRALRYATPRAGSRGLRHSGCRGLCPLRFFRLRAAPFTAARPHPAACVLRLLARSPASSRWSAAAAVSVAALRVVAAVGFVSLSTRTLTYGSLFDALRLATVDRHSLHPTTPSGAQINK